MKVLLWGLLFASLIGCSQFKGDKGDKGDPGPGQVYLYQGPINSDDQLINTPLLVSNSVVNVYIQSLADGTFQIPIFAPGISTNIYYIVGYRQIEIINANSIGAYWYKIYIINGAIPQQSMSGWSKVFP